MTRVFFVDRDLGRRILPDALERAGLAVERHDLHFAPDTPDEVWIPRVAQQGWVIVSGDKRILRRPREVRALVESQARMLILVGNHAPAAELAANLINTMPKIEKLLDEVQPPAVVRVYRPTPRELVFEGKPGRVQPKTLGEPERFG
ncbi:MAG: hypothetical protein OXE73_09880 [Gammaproteobacteria bacterium]|nr:hypothetical protein [Gammaproteobacteria bacterium]